MEKINICFLGNWNIGANILNTIVSKNNLIVTAVITTINQDDPFSNLVYDVSINNKINVMNTNNTNWRLYLEENTFDLLISISFGYILKSQHYKHSKYGAINLHQSILPDFRGPDPILNAIIKNEDKIGFTIHYIDEGTDTGNVLYQSLWPLLTTDTLETINKKIIDFSKAIICYVIEEFVIKEGGAGIIQNGTSSNAPKIKPLKII